MKIRITDQGFKNYTGQFGMTEFANGVSVDHVAPQEINRLASLIAICDDETDTQVGPGFDFEAHYREMEAPHDKVNTTTAEEIAAQREKELKARQEAKEKAAKIAAEMAAAAKAQKEKEVTEDDIDPAKVDRETLEIIADKKGIAGVRAIADKVGVKANSIASLIGGILSKNGK